MNKMAENLIHYKTLFTKNKTLHMITNMDTNTHHTHNRLNMINYCP